MKRSFIAIFINFFRLFLQKSANLRPSRWMFEGWFMSEIARLTPAFAAGLERSGKPVRHHTLVNTFTHDLSAQKLSIKYLLQHSLIQHTGQPT